MPADRELWWCRFARAWNDALCARYDACVARAIPWR